MTLRLARQHVLERAPREAMVDVVRELVGLQAQVTSAAELQLAARVDGLRPDDIPDALATDRTLVKTWAMRGTLHVLAADDLARIVAAYPTRDPTGNPAWIKAFGANPTQVTRFVDEIGSVLTDEPLTRAELADAVEHVVHDAAAAARLRSGWGEFLKPAAGRGLLCFGPDRGRNVTFVAPDAWLGATVAAAWQPDGDSATRTFGELVGRWLRAFPGAGRDGVARWWAMQRKPLVTRAIETVGLDLVDVDIEGTKGWVPLDLAPLLGAGEPEQHVRLLPTFDPWTNETPRRTDAVLAIDRHDAVHRVAGWVSAVVVVDGRVAGTWEITRGRQTTIEVRPFVGGRRAATRAELEAEADRIAAFLDVPIKVSVAKPA